ncbi:MAG: hypothetical protein M0C28_07135 [Candidatus Moduliflexus flocculans]|nr:hypothetical protein [Candidatus Moduliflexus flocculans]
MHLNAGGRIRRRACSGTAGRPATSWAIRWPSRPWGRSSIPSSRTWPTRRASSAAVKRSNYAGLFEKVFGPGSLDADKDPQAAYAEIGRAIAAYERSAEVNTFSSKFDDFWRAALGQGARGRDDRRSRTPRTSAASA